ncbi:type IX secretion system membrane protein PorP/SprF [Cytophagaceae bacterium ABcell3]|nr:type IX secretion system membrane protein PorP/SprF [Cytophagaceae bacterium ABcell3]
MFSLSLQAQDSDLYPDLFSSFIFNPSLINPGYVSDEGVLDLIGNYKQRTGPFSAIATYAFTATGYRRQDNGVVHTGRVFMFNEAEGPYISRPRAYLNYANRMPLAEDLFLSAGLALGFAGNTYSAPTVSGVGSSFVPDGHVGIMLSSSKFSGGVSAMQIFNTEASPLAGVLTYRRYFNLFFSAQHEFTPDWAVKGFLTYSHYRELDPASDVGFFLNYKDLISFGSSYRYLRGSAIFFSVNIPQAENNILLSFAYNSPLFSSRPLWQNSLEITLGYLFR